MILFAIAAPTLIGTAPLIIEYAQKNIKAVCEARETALSALENATILKQITSKSPEDQAFLMKIYLAGNVSYCEADKLQKLLGTDKSKSIDRLRYSPCEVYICLTGG